MPPLQEEAAALGKSSFAFAFYMDRQKEERERGVTISCTTKEFFTDSFHYTIIDAPGEWLERCGAREAAWGLQLALPPASLPPIGGGAVCRLLSFPAAPLLFALTFCPCPPTPPACPQATGISSRT